jgi:hypothetical protein
LRAYFDLPLKSCQRYHQAPPVATLHGCDYFRWTVLPQAFDCGWHCRFGFFVRGDGEGLEIPRYARLAVKAVILTAL